jgi:antitoxin FitA
MAADTSITIRRLDPALKRRLRVRAAAHGRSMEEEAREILKASLAAGQPAGRSWVDTIRKRFAAAGYVELEIPPWEPVGAPPEFE